MPKESPTRVDSHLIHYIDHAVSIDQTSLHLAKGMRVRDCQKGCKVCVLIVLYQVIRYCIEKRILTLELNPKRDSSDQNLHTYHAVH